MLLQTVILSSLLLSTLVDSAWGSDSESSIYGNSLSRDWLYNSNAISMKLEGCMWGYVGDNEESGCMEDESEDGTTYWYQMANCRRPQAVYSLYASSSGSASCSSSDFKESFVTLDGLSEFIYYLSNYDANNPFGDNVNGDANDDENGEAGGGGYDGDFDNLPNCEGGENGYIGLGCGDDGTFNLQYYSDQYCLQPSGVTYDSLDNLNYAMQTYTNCAGIWYSNGNGGDGYSLPYYLVSSSESCSSLDSGLCVDNSDMKSRRSHTGSSHLPLKGGFSGKTWVTKLKYATGGLLLLASFVMFTGILFTNRRRRRALLQRKYRQSRHSRSKSKGRSKSKSRKASRSRSRAKREHRENTEDGVYA